MIDASESPRRWPIVCPCRCVVSDWPRLWPIRGAGLGEAPALHGLGDDRPSGAEQGVLFTEVGAVEVDNKVLEADIGVKGEALGCGEDSFILADFGGTSGGVESELSLVAEFCLTNRGGCGAEVEGMTRGARILGDKGCFGDPDPCLGVELWLDSLLAWPGMRAVVSDIAISAFSSNAGPDMQESMLSPKTFWRQLLPGALIDLSCNGGLPGIVAAMNCKHYRCQLLPYHSRESIAISCTVVIGPNSGTLIFLRRMRVCSLGFGRAALPTIDRSFSACPIAEESTVSGSGLFRPATEGFSFVGNSWYFRDSLG